MKHKFPIILFTLLLLVASVSLIEDDEPLVRIMPLGDSITQGNTDNDSYRRPLWALLSKNNNKIDFVGSMKTNYPYGRFAHYTSLVFSNFDIDHEGHWGWRVDEVLSKIDGWAEKSVPDIALIHLGSNDIFQKQKNEDTVEEVRQVIVALRKHNPRIKILLAQIIPVTDKLRNKRIQAFNDLLPKMAQLITTDDSPVHIVDQYEGFDAFKDTYDGIHPNESGSKKMAQKWYASLMIILERPREGYVSP